MRINHGAVVKRDLVLNCAGYLGFTLIEMMIAILVSLFLLVMVSEVVFSMKKMVIEQDSLAKTESQALQVMRYLNQTVSYAGLIGCFNVDRQESVINHVVTEQGALTGVSVLVNDHAALSVTLGYPLQTIAEPMTNNAEIIVQQSTGFYKNDVVVIADCSRAEVDKIEAIRKIINKQAYKITLQQPLDYHYQPYATIAVLHHYRFFTRSPYYDKHSSALFMAEDHGQDQELVPDVNHLTFRMLPDNQRPRAVAVDFTISIPGQHQESVWQFVIPLLERL